MQNIQLKHYQTKIVHSFHWNKIQYQSFLRVKNKGSSSMTPWRTFKNIHYTNCSLSM